MHPEAARVGTELADAIAAALGQDLVGLVLHGSAVLGDFAPHRSDLDLLAALRSDPDEQVLARLAALHQRFDRSHPHWAGRIEVEYVALDLLTGVDPSRRFARVSPGESLHLVPASDHYLLNRASARNGVALIGPAPHALVPEVPPVTVRAVVRRHVEQWPEWVRENEAPGFLAYAVLTLCRARLLLEHDRRGSKHESALQAEAELPEHADLVRWADRWWYDDGTDDGGAPRAAVLAFVDEQARELLAAHPAPSSPFADPEELGDTPA
ncbi:DUF4111 domain-containing protein [Amnibacterium sp. CER49]|uniref:aminoglycoside adenylyltransferase domain-containing protein n=1 Tax=Amnibacterium sp. CER49 TaxID=3039161 RepID=UPI002448CFF8|nr:aminoglycoside adenylyltransferase domain-containing protein [Amnibacterium sp. CER49]MDH2445485.1 DUF4111 domain-containing protein [Amnibacterium sp. CER49]